MDALRYGLVDFDNHYYEPEDAFTRYGDEEVRRFVHWVSEGSKRHIIFGHAVPTAIPNPTFNPIGKPGAYHERLKELASHGEVRNVDPMERLGELEPLRDEYHDRDTRLNRVQAQKHKPAATRVRIMNAGSVTSRVPSAKTRKTCARVINPKTVPVVMR